MNDNWQHSWDQPSGLYLQSRRQGKPLLLMLHGIGDWSEQLRPLADLLSGNFDCLIPDLRGHGFSPRRDGYQAIDYAGDMARLLEAFDEPVYCYGHSLGALIALWLAGEKSQHIRGCVLEDPPPLSSCRKHSPAP